MNDENMKAWLESQKKVLDGIGASICMASIVGDNYLKSLECMLQIGAAILLDKPIILIVLDNTVIPEKLRGVADRVIRVGRNEMDRAAEELAEFTKSLKEKK